MTVAQRRLLLSALFDDGGDVIRECYAHGINTLAALQRADLLAVGPTFVAALQRAGVLQSLPEVEHEACSEVLVRNVLQNRLALRDLAATCALLTDAGMEPIALKGAAVCAHRPERGRERHMDDLDLLVDEAAAERAFRLLLANGFKPHGAVPDARSHQLQTLAAPSGTLVELHVRAPGLRGQSGSHRALLAETVVLPVEGRPVRVPTLSALVAQLCAHVVIHHGSVLRYWPRHLTDLERLGDRCCDVDDPAVSLAISFSRAVQRAAREEALHGRPHSLSRALLFPSPPVAATIGTVGLVGTLLSAAYVGGPRGALDRLRAGSDGERDVTAHWRRARTVAARWLTA